MKQFVILFCLVVAAMADVSHLKNSGYVYNVPSPAFELPSAPGKEYLPPTPPASVEEQLPEVISPKPQYLPPVEISTPVLPIASSNEYLPPSEEPIPEISLPSIVEPVKEYLPPSEAPLTEYLPPSVAPTEEYQSAKETGGYRYDAPLTKFRF